MKYIKTFEDTIGKNPRLPDLFKLLKHLKIVFQDFRYTLDEWYNNLFEFSLNNKNGRVFDITGDFCNGLSINRQQFHSTTLIFL